MRAEIFWAVVSKRGEVQIETISHKRKDAIAIFLWGKYEWKELKKYGWRCVKVTIQGAV